MSPEADIFPERYRSRHQARYLYGALADDYAEFYSQTDEAADALARWMSGNGDNNKALFEEALRHGVDRVPNAPEALRDFFEAFEHVPDWVDFDQIALGARAYQRFGLLGLIILSAWSLINGYHSSAAVKPLALTGRLNHNAQRRLAETARYVSEASQVNGLRRGHAGYEISARVRLIHAHVRHACLGAERWDALAWGHPINQADMFGTLLEFSFLMMEGARRLGFALSEEERTAILALWRYAGHLNGVDPWLLAHLSDESKTARIAHLIRLVQPGPDADSVALTQALLEVPAQNARQSGPKWLATGVSRFHDGLARALNGQEIADDLGLPDDLWQHAIYPARAIIASLEALRVRIPGATEWAVHTANTAIRRDVRRVLRGVEPRYEPTG